jgi:hypothetical protein
MAAMENENQFKTKIYQLSLFFLLFLIIAVPRFVGLEEFVTVDEPDWLRFSANFYYSIARGDFENTVFDYHPGVTTMWVGTAANLIEFPEYRGYGQGLFFDRLEFFDFLESKDADPLRILFWSRLINLSVIVAFLLVCYVLLRTLLGGFFAFWTIAFISSEPFFLGHSRILNHEGMLTVFLVVSILGYCTYFFHERKFMYLMISAVSAGLAFLTKSSAIILFPVILLIVAISLFSKDDPEIERGTKLKTALRSTGVWFLILLFVFIILWPGLWAAPGKMMTEMFGNAFSYALQGERLLVTQELVPENFSVSSNLLSVWIGFLLGGVSLFRNTTEQSHLEKILVVVFAATGLAMIALFAVAQGRNSAHYLLTSYISFNFVAGSGYFWAARKLLKHSVSNRLEYSMLAGILLLQILFFAGQYPYFYTYTNPVMRAILPTGENPNYGYCEGLEKAGAYLSAKPGAEQMKAMSWYPLGCFSYFYSGTTVPLFVVDDLNEKNFVKLQESDYLVIYYAAQTRRNMPANLLAALKNQVPEHSIWLNDIEYVHIYDVQAFPASFFSDLAETLR